MSKCGKVKNPCKICLGPVTQKTGLQCQGACDNWVHYSCLNYTPGRIQDIKKGVIKITCPCPDCKTTQPKEYRTDEPYSCTNIECPANKPLQCQNPVCPSNKGSEKMNQTSGHKGSQGQKAPQPVMPLNKCGAKDCKQHSSPNVANQSGPQTPPQFSSPKQGNQFNGMPMTGSSSDACLDFNRCPSGCSSANVAGDMHHPSTMPMDGMPSMCTMEQMCNTVGLLSKQINELMTKMQQASPRQGWSNGGGMMGGGGGMMGGGGGMMGGGGGMMGGGGGMMGGGMNGHSMRGGGSVGAGGRGGCCSNPNSKAPCGQHGPKALCPKPCFCPDNPGVRK